MQGAGLIVLGSATGTVKNRGFNCQGIRSREFGLECRVSHKSSVYVPGFVGFRV